MDTQAQDIPPASGGAVASGLQRDRERIIRAYRVDRDRVIGRLQELAAIADKKVWDSGRYDLDVAEIRELLCDAIRLLRYPIC